MGVNPGDSGLAGDPHVTNTPSNAKHDDRIQYFYQSNSLGPFTVVVEGPRDKSVGNMNPLSIAKMLSQLKLQNVRGPLRKGKNKIIIEFSNAEAANSFVSSSSSDIIRGVQFDFTLEEILNNIQSTVDILKVVRFNRRSLNEKKEVVFVKTGTCLLTFSGKSIPKSINLYGVEMDVENYIMPVTQCFNCFLFGHTKKQCRGAKCSDQGHSEDDCTKDFRCVLGVVITTGQPIRNVLNTKGRNKSKYICQ